MILFSLPAFAWDDTGHKITGYIAWSRMTPETRERVIKVLLAAPEDAQLSTYYQMYGSRKPDSRKREFFMLVTTWADIIRDKNFNTRFTKYNNGNWHYANTFWKSENGRSMLVDGQEETGLAMKKLAEFDALIRSNASDAEKAIAIAWLEHLIGDMHQPLHSSGKISNSSPKGDQGGNLFLLTPKGTKRENQENLHWFWDSVVVRYMPNSKDLSEGAYIDPIAEDFMKKYPYEKMKDMLQPAKYDAWAKESLEFAMNEVYKDLKFFEMPSDKYKEKAFKIAEKRLTLAGYRMGDLFNEVFGATSGSTSPEKTARIEYAKKLDDQNVIANVSYFANGDTLEIGVADKVSPSFADTTVEILVGHVSKPEAKRLGFKKIHIKGGRGSSGEKDTIDQTIDLK